MAVGDSTFLGEIIFINKKYEYMEKLKIYEILFYINVCLF